MSFFSCAGAPSYIFPPALSPTLVLYQLVPLHRPLCMSIFISVYIPKSTVFFDVFFNYTFFKQGCPKDPLENQMVKPNFVQQTESNKHMMAISWASFSHTDRTPPINY